MSVSILAKTRTEGYAGGFLHEAEQGKGKGRKQKRQEEKKKQKKKSDEKEKVDHDGVRTHNFLMTR